MAGIYVHIPFCKSRCIYCDFYSTVDESLIEDYVRALCREISGRRAELPSLRVCTIYIGGGTPSLLRPEQLQHILTCIRDNYDVTPDAEITIEVNPEDVTPDFARQLTAFNRVSIGLQSFDDAILKLLRRRHDAATAIQAVKTLQEAGQDNISIDLIYGLPHQTIEGWLQDLDLAFGLCIQHLSAYALSYERGTPLWHMLQQHKVEEAADELFVEMYRQLCLRAREKGFCHYEISNFALPHRESRHNSSYWTGQPYLGFGPGAHGYDGQRTRRANPSDLKAYLSHEKQEPILEHLTDDDLYDEAVMCGLRTRQGIDIQHLTDHFGLERKNYLLRMAEPHIQAGRLSLIEGHLRLEESALMVSDDVMSDLMF